MSSFDEENTQSIDYWQVVRNHWGIILITLILSVVTAFVITSLISPTYEAKTRFVVNPNRLTVDSYISKGGLAQNQDAAFYGNQLITMRSEEVLKVVDGIDKETQAPLRKFTANYGADYQAALSVLKNKIVVEMIAEGSAQSTVFEVRAYDADKVKAKELANAVRDGYELHRLHSRQTESGETHTQQVDDYKKARQRQDDLFEQLQESSKRSNLPHTVDSMSDLKNEAKEKFEMKRVQQINLTESIRQYEIVAAEVLKKNDKELISYLETSDAILTKAGVSELNNEIGDLKTAKTSDILSGLGERHPTIILKDKMIGQKEQELKESLVGVREAVTQKLELEKAKKDSIEESIDKLSEEFADYTKKYIEHERLIEEHSLAKSEALALRIEGDNTDKQQAYLSKPIEILSSAALPNKQFSPDVTLIMGIGTAAGLVFGLSIAFLLELMDTSVKTMEDVERYLNLPVLAVVPQDVGLLYEVNGDTPDAEAYRILRTNVEFNRKNPEDNAITVVSGGAGEGKSTTLMNLAYVCAQGGYTTLIIDADLRRPKLHTYFGLSNEVGLSHYLTTGATLENVVSKTSTENLFFMASGQLPTDVSSILNSRRMTDMITEVKQRFDLVLVDSPPILGVSDASVISSEVDHTIIVIQHRKLPRKLLQRVKQSVENVGGNIIGVVLNNVDVRSDTEYQYYTSYYTYYSPSEMKKAEASVSKKPAQEAAQSDGIY